jgi:hypothetical protein
MRISPGFTLKAQKERMALQDQALEECYLNDLRKAGLSEELAIRRGEYWNVSSPPYSVPTSSAIAASWETTLRTLSSYRKFLDSLIEQLMDASSIRQATAYSAEFASVVNSVNFPP